MSENNQKKYTIISVCQRGELEVNAALLIYTLQKYISADIQFVIGIPNSKKYNLNPHDFVIDYFRQKNVEIKYFDNEYLNTIETLTKTELIANKVYLLDNHYPSQKVLFLDSDMVCINKFNPDDIENLSGLTIKPANRASITKWEEVYKLTNVKMPEKHIQTTVDKKWLPNYFNSGVMLINDAEKEEFVREWKKYYNMLAEKTFINRRLYKNYFRDQVALSLAISNSNIKITQLDEKYNYPAGGKKIIKSQLPVLVHYHNPYNLCANTCMFSEIKSFLKEYPRFYEIIDMHKNWHRLLNNGYLVRKALTLKMKTKKRWGRMKDKFRMN